MFVYLLLFTIVIVFLYSFELHFSTTSFTTMIAFVGKDHVRTFEHEFQNVHADLWSFGHRKIKSSRVMFTSDTPFEIFVKYNYEHIVLIHTVHHIPLFFDTDSVIQYTLENTTIASLWPQLQTMPPSSKDALEWYVKKGGKVDVIHL